LSRFTKRVVINYDGDDAGVKAARRAIEHLLPQDFEIKILVLPNGQDPDDFIRQNGNDTYNEARGRAEPFLDFALASSMRGRNITNPRHKAEAIEDIVPLLTSVRNNIQRRESFDQAMDFYRVDDGLRKELWQTVRKSGVPSETDGIKKRVQQASQSKITKAEQKLLELLVYDPELQTVIFSHLEASDYEDLPTAPVFMGLMQLNQRNEEPNLENMLEMIGEDSILEDFVPLLLMTEPKRQAGETIDEVLLESEDCIVALRLMALDTKIKDIIQKKVEAERAGDANLMNRLVVDQLELEKMRFDYGRAKNSAV
jgi:DNA primase